MDILHILSFSILSLFGSILYLKQKFAFLSHVSRCFFLQRGKTNIYYFKVEFIILLSLDDTPKFLVETSVFRVSWFLWDSAGTAIEFPGDGKYTVWVTNSCEKEILQDKFIDGVLFKTKWNTNFLRRFTTSQTQAQVLGTLAKLLILVMC